MFKLPLASWNLLPTRTPWSSTHPVTFPVPSTRMHGGVDTMLLSFFAKKITGRWEELDSQETHIKVSTYDIQRQVDLRRSYRSQQRLRMLRGVREYPIAHPKHHTFGDLNLSATPSRSFSARQRFGISTTLAINDYLSQCQMVP